MTRGRKPIPTNLKIVRGTQRPGRENKDEPKLPVAIPEPPGHLTEREANVFREQAELLAKMRVITEADSKALAIFARAWVEHLDAHAKMIETGGLVVEAPKTKVPRHNLYKKVRDDAEKRALSILIEFGLTPSSRARVKST